MLVSQFSISHQQIKTFQERIVKSAECMKLPSNCEIFSERHEDTEIYYVVNNIK